jgi:hypothetical protein
MITNDISMYLDIPQGPKRFHEVPWCSLGFDDILMNQSVSTEDNRGVRGIVVIASSTQIGVKTWFCRLAMPACPTTKCARLRDAMLSKG